MGFRFRKSVKICKGLKVNFSKSGASLSLGGRGHSLNVGKRSRVTLGIPGTGLSYSTSLSGHHKSHKSGSSRTRSTNRGSSRISTIPLPNQVKVIMSDAGKIELRDNRDNIITDPSVVRKIKSTDSYKNMVQNLEIQRQQKIEEVYSEAKAENDKFIEIYKQSPQVDKQEQYVRILNSLRPPIYVRKEYAIPCPSEGMIRTLLQSEAKNNVTGSFFKVGKLRKEYVESNIQARLNSEIDKWNEAKRQFEAEEDRIAINETKRYNDEFNADKQYMRDLIDGNTELITYILISALIIFNVEPDSFNTFFDAVYWATVSLTTVGYGDIYPVSTIGRIVTMISSIFGIAIIALPSGIITGGYLSELNKENNQ